MHTLTSISDLLNKPVRPLAYALLVPAAFIIAGCGGGGGSDGGAMTLMPPVAQSITVSIETQDRFQQQSDTFALGEDIGFVISGQNTSFDTVTLMFECADGLEFYVTDSNGDEVWRLSDIRPCGEPSELILIPSSSVTSIFTWAQINSTTLDPVPSGAYTLFGSFEDQSPVAQTDFTIL